MGEEEAVLCLDSRSSHDWVHLSELVRLQCRLKPTNSSICKLYFNEPERKAVGLLSTLAFIRQQPNVPRNLDI